MNSSKKPTRKMIKAVHAPAWTGANPYLLLLQEGARSAGTDIQLTDFPQGPFPLTRLSWHFRNYDILHLHWINALVQPIAWSNSRIRRRIKLALLVLDMKLSHLFVKRLAWTVHNLVSHESPNSEIEKATRKVFARYVDLLIFHSEGAKKVFEARITPIPKRVRSAVIPHGNYIEVYPDTDTDFHTSRLKSELGLTPNTLTIMFFGALKRYKGILNVLDAIKHVPRKDIQFLIAGMPENAELRELLLEEAKADSRIKLYLEYVPDEFVSAFFEIGTSVILPIEEGLTSGSAVLAASMGKALILNSTCAHFEVGHPNGVINYSSEAELASILMNAELNEHDRIGKLNVSVAASNDWRSVGSALSLLYEEQITLGKPSK